MDLFYLAFMIVFSVLEIELIKNIFGEVRPMRIQTFMEYSCLYGFRK